MNSHFTAFDRHRLVQTSVLLMCIQNARHSSTSEDTDILTVIFRNFSQSFISNVDAVGLIKPHPLSSKSFPIIIPNHPITN